MWIVATPAAANPPKYQIVVFQRDMCDMSRFFSVACHTKSVTRVSVVVRRNRGGLPAAPPARRR